MRGIRVATVFVVGLLCTGLCGEGWANDLAPSGVCMQEGQKLVGASPILIGKSVRQPKKVRNVAPKYPELPPGTRGSGRWIGEFLLDVRGKVATVWTIQEVDIKPSFPAFNQAIVDAVRRWEFEPLLVNGRATPVCATVVVLINWS
jgi:hypothetical protein